MELTTWSTVLIAIAPALAAIMTIIAFASYMPETFRQFKERFSKENKASE